jgi:hypothetical protein
MKTRAVAQMPPPLTRSLRNLSRRPPAPAKGNGRLQRQARRVLWAVGAASTSQILQWTCCDKLHRGKRITVHDSRAARRALQSIGATRTGRAMTSGRPWIWRLQISE